MPFDAAELSTTATIFDRGGVPSPRCVQGEQGDSDVGGAADRFAAEGRSAMMKVLGVDLASRSWRDIGFAEIAFDSGDPPSWGAAVPDCVVRPTTALTPHALADLIDEYARDHEIAAVALDGPQGWRQPNAPPRRGVGRWCEYEARTQGKTGEYGHTYPQTQHGWIAFCVEVFDRLLGLGHCTLVDDPAATRLQPLERGRYYLLEVFPTSTWRGLGLRPLPGHANAPPHVVAHYAGLLRARLGLPQAPATNHHDNLQALVASLAGAALLGGPCSALARGRPSIRVTTTPTVPAHRAEGLIWDAVLGDQAAMVEATVAPAVGLAVEDEAGDRENPILPDDRDDSTEELMRRGVALFERLVARANAGDAVGIGYGNLVARVHGVESFADVAGRDYLPSDSEYVVRLAMRVTEASGGRKTVARGGHSIMAGMDTFVWAVRSIDRPLKAWSSRWAAPPYTRDEWLRIFPDGHRSLLAD